MRKYKQREIKNLVRDGLAKDITAFSFEQISELSKKCNIEKIGYSLGIYGINAGLLKDRTSGEYYAITERNSTLSQLF